VGRDNQYIEPVHLMAARSTTGWHGFDLAGERPAFKCPSCARIWPVRWTGLPKSRGPAVKCCSATTQQAVECDGQAGAAAGDQFISSELFVLAACDDRGELGVSEGERRHTLSLEKAIDEVRGGAR